jgi:hypothetical protein
MSKQIFKKKVKDFKDYECNYYINKNGKIKYFQDINYRYKRYLCILNNILKFDAFILSLVGKNEDDVIQNLLFLNFLKTQNLKYIILKKKDDIIYISKENNIDYLLNFLFFVDLVDNNKFNINIIQNNNIKLFNDFEKELINKLSINFFVYKSKYSKIENNKVLTYLFFKIYIYLIEDELLKKFNILLDNFASYNDLYKFLKKKEYVYKFYNIYGPIIINNSNIIYNYIMSNPALDEFKKKINFKIKDFSEINLNYLIDKKMYQNFNKIYIKNNFLRLIKKI